MLAYNAKNSGVINATSPNGTHLSRRIAGYSQSGSENKPMGSSCKFSLFAKEPSSRDVEQTVAFLLA
jgi:hypothetical protein